jgi:hypothetical protein
LDWAESDRLRQESICDLGGDGLGLVGADEPRYAQIAHEMLDRFDSAHT